MNNSSHGQGQAGKAGKGVELAVALALQAPCVTLQVFPEEKLCSWEFMQGRETSRALASSQGHDLTFNLGTSALIQTWTRHSNLEVTCTRG